MNAVHNTRSSGLNGGATRRVAANVSYATTTAARVARLRRKARRLELSVAQRDGKFAIRDNEFLGAIGWPGDSGRYDVDLQEAEALLVEYERRQADLKQWRADHPDEVTKIWADYERRCAERGLAP